MASRSASDRLRYEGGQAPFDGWNLVDVTGRHRERFLHSQLTSDVRGLEIGASHLSALLDASGRLQSFFFLGRGHDRVALLVPSQLTTATIDGLERNLVADDVRFAVRDTGPMRLALGPEAVRLMPELPAGTVFALEAFADRGFVTWAGVDLPLPELEPDLLEGLRVITGLPRWDVEVAAGMLVNETTLADSAISHDKGCYLGQETVSKVRSGRGAAYAPALLGVDGEVESPQRIQGKPFRVSGRKGGVVRSWTVWNGELMLQASLFRDFRVEGAQVDFEVEGATLTARVALLPLVTTRSRQEVGDDLFHRAVDLFARDREDDAVDLLERAIAVCPDHADAYESLGVILGRHGEYERAITLMQRLLEIDPDSVMAHTNMSLYHNQLGRIEEAEAEAREAALAGVRRRRQEQQRADEQSRDRDARQAELDRRHEMFRQVLEIDPDDALGNFGMGELCVETGRFEDAVRHLEAAVGADEKYSAAYLALGRAWEGMHRLDTAREVYTRGVEVAARRGDLQTANRMQQRLAELPE